VWQKVRIGDGEGVRRERKIVKGVSDDEESLGPWVRFWERTRDCGKKVGGGG